MSRTAFTALALVAFTATPARAMNVQVNFSGSVHEIVAFDYSTGGPPALAAEIGGSVAVGTPFSGSFSFDDAEAAVSGDIYQATYHLGDPFGGFALTLGDYAIASDSTAGFDLGVHDGDYYGYGTTLVGAAHSLTGAGATSLDSLTFDLTLGSNSPDLLSPTPLSAVPWELAAYSQGGRTTWSFVRGSEFVAVFGTLDALSLAAVPEPTVGALIALGGLALARLGFRRALR